MPGADQSGIFRIGGELPIHRMGYGAMQLIGRGAVGTPANPEAHKAVLKRAIELGVDFIDTADVYGPFLNEKQIAEVLYPYPKRLVLATKGASIRVPGRFVFNSTPLYLREALEGSLRRLKLDCVDLYQVHRLDGETPIEDTIGALADLRAAGKLRHIGLSEVGVAEIERARAVAPIATVQNLYHLQERRHDDVLAYCEAHGIGFLPWYPLGSGALTAPDGPLKPFAERLNATPAQVALAWLLARSPNMILIPGTSSVKHLEQNVGACDVRLSIEDVKALTAMHPTSR